MKQERVNMVLLNLSHHTRVAEVAFRAYAHGYTRGCAHNQNIDPSTPVDRLAAMLADKLRVLGYKLAHPDWYGVDLFERLHTELVTLDAALPTRTTWKAETGRELLHRRLPNILATIIWNLRTLIDLMKVA